MPVDVLLKQITSTELNEWRAYETKNGPIDDGWRDEAQANQMDLVRLLTYLTSQAHFGSDGKKSVQGPVEMPKKPYLRPQYSYLPEPPDEEDPEAAEEHDARQVELLNETLSQREKKG